MGCCRFQRHLVKVEVKPEVVHGEKKDIQPRVQAQAVKLVTERGVVVAQAAKDLDSHENVMRKWVRELRDEPPRRPALATASKRPRTRK